MYFTNLQYVQKPLNKNPGQIVFFAFFVFLHNFMMKSETSDRQDPKEDDDMAEQQKLITTFKRMHKFYRVFKAINKPPL